MDRRTFLQRAVAAGLWPLATIAGCGGADRRGRPDPTDPPLDDVLAAGARTMWVAAHPDDECFPGGLLARASIHYRNPLAFVVMTHGDGGECGLPDGCEPDLATVRGREMAQVARMYRARLYHHRYWNAPLPVSSFPPRREILARWRAQGDPLRDIVTAIRDFRPDLLVTFDPYVGATGHPEHQLTARLAVLAVRQAADPTFETPGLSPHRVARTILQQNRFWVFRLGGGGDPGPVTHTFDASLPAVPGLSCAHFMAEATRLHRTQENDMGMVRRVVSAGFLTLYFRRVDPWRDFFDPDE
ncbi:MAG TPA: PIG-L family deacetylase [Myxococcota bacterium]|nr:PIG-L family deacetylase [Myxococcota bacterium]HQK50542.1 PIG-L family deacetylase [Myxococcota bacterium]